jgi:hypothetical protein
MVFASRIESEPRVLASGGGTLEPISPDTGHDRKVATSRFSVPPPSADWVVGKID